MKERWTKRIAALLLAVIMILGTAACTKGAEPAVKADNDKQTTTEANKTTPDETTPETTDAPAEEKPFAVYDNDEDIYMANLGEFYEAFQAATTTAENVSQRYALLAVAEAKAIESGVGTPMYGGTAGYNMSRIVYCSGGYAGWRGTMSDLTQYVITNEIITAEDYKHLKELRTELVGTGTYMTKAVEYLTEKGYTFRDTYTSTFVDNPTTWDIFAASTSNDSGIISPTLDYLYAYDAEGVLQPHLAESCEISEDGKVYTLKIRPGQIWVDSQGRKVADVTADDWVAAAQHQADLQDCYDLNNYIEGMTAYVTGETTDFSTVGVKALDDLTLQYTLKEPATYFMSLLQKTGFLPLCRSYFVSQGGAFGLDAFSEAQSKPSYQYGIDQNHVAVCGQFLCINMTEKNSVTYVLNENYWNASNANLKAVKLTFSDSSDVSRSYDDFMNGTVVSMYLNSQRLELAKKKGDFEKYAFVNDVGRITFLFWFNIHRQTYANMADGAGASRKTEAEKALSCAALQNKHFRLAIGHAIDRGAYVSQNVGEDLSLQSVRNSITPGTYVNLEEDVTIDINGTATTFPKGTWYGAIVQAQLDADNFGLQIWDAENLTNDGWDAWYNPAKAMEELQIAIEELKAAGYEVSKENPIVMDYPYPSYNEVGQNQCYVLKTCIESAFDGLVRFDALPLNNVTEFLNVGNNTNNGSEHNTDMGGLGCIGSDHGDPICYLDGLLPYGDGRLTQKLGLW